MTEFDLENLMVDILMSSDLYKKESPFFSGKVYKCGTRTSINDEDAVVEVLSLDDKQFQNALVSVKIYINDINMGSPNLVPDVGRLQRATEKVESVFKTRNSSYALTTAKFRMRLESAKRERKEELKQHCINCIFQFVTLNI